jgi:hypothetical protein
MENEIKPFCFDGETLKKLKEKGCEYDDIWRVLEWLRLKHSLVINTECEICSYGIQYNWQITVLYDEAKSTSWHGDIEVYKDPKEMYTTAINYILTHFV